MSEPSTSPKPDSNSSTPSTSSSQPPLSALFPPIFFPSSDHNPSPSNAPPHARSPIPPYTDQGCLSWCAQSSTRQLGGKDPMCRMMCFKVRKREGIDEVDMNELERNRLKTGAYSGRRRRGDLSSSERGGDVVEQSGIEMDRPVWDMKAIQDWRRSIRRWIDERELLFFRGTLEEMREVQTGRVEDGKVEAMRKNESTITETARVRESSDTEGKWKHRTTRDEEFLIERKVVGENGSLILIPLPSLLITPFQTWYTRVSRLFQPGLSFLSKYYDSFGDGTQERVRKVVWERMREGGQLEFAGKLGMRIKEHWSDQAELFEEKMASVEKEKERNRQRAQEAHDRAEQAWRAQHPAKGSKEEEYVFEREHSPRGDARDKESRAREALERQRRRQSQGDSGGRQDPNSNVGNSPTTED